MDFQTINKLSSYFARKDVDNRLTADYTPGVTDTYNLGESLFKWKNVYATNVIADNLSGTISAEHDVLTGLGDDDHTQYVHISIARTITAQHQFAPGTTTAPFTLGVNAQDQVVTGFLADHVNKSVTAGQGLSGGGALTAGTGVTLTVGAGTGISVGADDVGINYAGGGGSTIQPDDSSQTGSSDYPSRADHKHAIVAAAASTLSVSTTNTEGSSTSFARADHTHAITSSSNPGAATSLLKTDSSGFLNLVRLNADTIADRSGGNLTIAPAGDVIFNPTGNDILPSNNYDLNIGSLSKKYLTLYAAELWVETLVAQETIATIGGRILVGPTTTLTSDLAPASSSMNVKHNNLSNGDMCYMEANGQVEFIKVTSSPSGTGPYTYSIARNQEADPGGAEQWYAGDAIFNTGASGDGFIDLYSVQSIKGGTQAGPTIVGNLRNSSTYNDFNEVWAIGNLDGLYGYGVDTYGVGLGKYATNETNVIITPTDGFKLRNYTTDIIELSSSGLYINDIAGSAVFSFVVGSTTNLVSNPGFETAGGGGTDIFANWTENAGTGTITQDPTTKRSGSYGLKFTAGSSADTYLYQDITVTALTNYKWEFYTRGLGNDPEDLGFYAVYDVTNSEYIIEKRDTGVVSTSFTSVIVEFTTPPSCVSVRLYLYGPVTNTYINYFDDNDLEKVSTATFSSPLNLLGTSGIWQGKGGSFSNPWTGFKLYQSGGLGVWETWEEGRKQVYIDPTDMSLVAGSDGIRLNRFGTFYKEGLDTNFLSTASNEIVHGSLGIKQHTTDGYILTLQASEATNTNKCLNPGFELDTEWTLSGSANLLLEYYQGDSFEGNRSLKITVTHTGTPHYGYVEDSFTLSSGKQYEVSCWHKWISYGSGTDVEPDVVMSLQRSPGAGFFGEGYLRLKSQLNQWVYTKFVTPVIGISVSGKIYFNITAGGSSGEYSVLLLDKVAVKELSAFYSGIHLFSNDAGSGMLFSLEQSGGVDNEVVDGEFLFREGNIISEEAIGFSGVAGTSLDYTVPAGQTLLFREPFSEIVLGKDDSSYYWNSMVPWYSSYYSALVNLPFLRGLWMGQLDGNGNLLDFSPHANHLTRTGTSLLGNWFENGAAPLYLDSRNATTYLEIADNVDHDIVGNDTYSFTDYYGFTMGFWMRTPASGDWPTATPVIASKWNYSTAQRSYQMQLQYDTAKFAFITSADGSSGQIDGVIADAIGQTVTYETWYFVVGRMDYLTSWSIYLNGTWNTVTTGDFNSLAASTYAKIFNSSAQFRIGAAPATTVGLKHHLYGVFLCGAYLPDEIIDKLYRMSRFHMSNDKDF